MKLVEEEGKVRHQEYEFKIKSGEIKTGLLSAEIIELNGQSALLCIVNDYDLWGDTVNVASRMESSGKPGQIQVTASTYELLKDKFIWEKRGEINVKGKGQMITYWLTGRKMANC